MKTVPVGDFAMQVDYGVTASASKDPIGPKMLRITDIQEFGVNWATVPHCAGNTKGVQARQLEKGDIVFARTGSTGNSLLIRDCPEGAVFASYLIRLRVQPEAADPGYVSHFFRSPGYWRQIASASDGGVQKGVNASKLKKLLVPLPPIEEQRRIARVLDAADALRAKRREALAKLGTLTQAIFIDMFGDPIRNERGWPVRSLREACSRIQIGPFGSLLHRSDYVEGGIPLVNPMHIVDGVITPHREQTINSQKYTQLMPYRMETGDVVMGRRGEMGRVAIVGEHEAGYVCGSGSLYMRPDLDYAIPQYIAAALSSARGRRRLENSAQGVTMLNLNSDIVGSFMLGLPPIELQLEFSAMLTAHSELKAELRNHASALDELFASLQQRAFRGEL
ncbi:restriction endonuclease subunit S [Candidatus Poriferisodalis sp.]|uniref:restriction endonuclease subunit S n=1 Tax=Candidatus Poriferisodalis sp. TaxID=3101277 RepID=UPI003B5A624C